MFNLHRFMNKAHKDVETVQPVKEKPFNNVIVIVFPDKFYRTPVSVVLNIAFTGKETEKELENIFRDTVQKELYQVRSQALLTGKLNLTPVTRALEANPATSGRYSIIVIPQKEESF